MPRWVNGNRSTNHLNFKMAQRFIVIVIVIVRLLVEAMLALCSPYCFLLEFTLAYYYTQLSVIIIFHFRYSSCTLRQAADIGESFLIFTSYFILVLDDS